MCQFDLLIAARKVGPSGRVIGIDMTDAMIGAARRNIAEAGISEAVAETIVDLGIDWGGIDTLSDLQTGLVVALHSLGMELGRR